MKTITSLLAILALSISVQAQTKTDIPEEQTFYNLNQAYLSPKNVQRLYITHQHLNVDTLDLSAFVNLQHLVLSYDSLLTLPKGLEKLEKLTVLDISGNGFTVLPEQLAHIPNLEELYLNNEKNLDLEQSFKVLNQINHLKRLHLDSISNLKFPKHLTLNNNLEYLSMRYDGLNYIPQEIKKFKHLKTLDLEGNEIKSINRYFLKNKEIESLTLSLDPQFDFKKSFSILAKEPRLSSLTIANSTFDPAKSDFSMLTNITSLSLHNDHLKNFPTSILQLKNLKNLDLSGNDFNLLPSTFVSLSKLESLDLSNSNYLDFDQTAGLIRYLPSLHLVKIQDYNFTFDAEDYSYFKQSGQHVELFPGSKKDSTVHMFKRIVPVSIPAANATINNFNAERFGVRLSLY